MSDSGQIGADECEEELVFQTWEVGEKDPSNVYLDELIHDIDEAHQDLELISDVNQDEEKHVEEDIAILEEEKLKTLGFHESPQVRETLGGDSRTTPTISSNSEKDSSHAMNPSKQELLSALAPIQKINLTVPDAQPRPAETGTQKEVKETGQNRPSTSAVPIPQGAEWIYRAAAHVIQNPYSSAKTPCVGRLQGGRSVHEYARPNSSRRRSIRNLCPISSSNPYGLKPTNWEVNPAASVPMRARPWRARSSRKPRQPVLEEWKKVENAVKEQRDRDMAMKLGYETLVGNVVHIDIPGARDLNRSWNHFLSQDVMSWGFPYWKGSTERPQEPVPPPYLVYELKEKLWRYPRARYFKTA